MELELYIHSKSCDHCKPMLSFMSAIIETVNSDDVKLIVYESDKSTKSFTKKNIDANDIPVVALPSGCKIRGPVTHEMIGTLACSLLTKSKVPVQSVDRFELDKKDAKLLVNVASAIIENQSAYTLRREKSFTFIIKESTKDVPLSRYEKLIDDTTIFLMTNFEKKPSPKLYEFGLHPKVFLGHIIRDNIILTANLIIWRNRASHITYFRIRKDPEGNYIGTCSCLLGEGKKMLRDFYKPLFLTSSTINVEGNKGEGQNRIVANVKEINVELEEYLKK